MVETSTCYFFACGNTVVGNVDTCSKCGGRMRTPKAVRRLGWLQLVIGVFLVALMTVVTLNLAPLLLHPGAHVGGGEYYTGTPRNARMILALFGVVIAFGIGTMVNGGWQIVTGRRNRAITIGTLVLAACLFLYTFMVRNALSSD